MLTDPPQVVNTSIFAGAKNVSLIDSQFIEVLGSSLFHWDPINNLTL